MEIRDLDAVAALQPLAFPPPFDPMYHWDPETLALHLRYFPEGQFVAEIDGRVVGSCSNALIPEGRWREGRTWSETVGSYTLRDNDPDGSTLYGMDIAVHPDERRKGVGRAFYETRFDFVKTRGLARFGTGTRLPGYARHAETMSAAEYADAVVAGRLEDRTLTPLLRIGMTYRGVKPGYMPDPESKDWGAILEWRP